MNMGIKQQNNQPSDIPASAAQKYAGLQALRENAVQLRVKNFQKFHSPSEKIIPALQLKFGPGSLHYLENLLGMTEYFNEKWYVDQYPEVAESGLSPVRHYLQTGWQKGWNPSADFDTFFYMKQYPVTGILQINPLIHFLETGIRDNFLPCCLNSLPSEEDYACLWQSPLFQADYYVKQLPSGACAGNDPIGHFLVFGWENGFDPSPDFSISQYYMANPDIPVTGLNPLLHYLKWGYAEGRSCISRNYEILKKSIFFDERQYRHRYGKELGRYSPLEHYLLFGWKKGYLPSDRFDSAFFEYMYWDMVGITEPPVCHYLKIGFREGRKVFPTRLPPAQYYFPPDFDLVEFMKRQDKILIALHQLDFSGVPMLSGKIASIFAAERKVAVISPFDGPLRQRCLDSGVPVIVDPSFFMTDQGTEKIKNAGFSVCLFNTLCLASVFLRCTKIIPSLLWIHENWTPDHLPQSIRDQLANAPYVFATSGITLDHVRQYAVNVRFLPYPVMDFGGKTAKKVPDFFRFALVANLENRKGQDIAVRAFRMLPGKYRKKASLTLIGDSITDDLPEELKKLAGNEKNIRFRDTVRELNAYHALYDQMEVLLCPSRTDPMPLVVFDAMMHGCPVILSDTVGQKDYIQNGKNGFVFKAEDEKALTSCMMRMMDSAADFPKMSVRIRQTFLENFEFSKAEKSVREAIAEVARLKPAQPSAE